jgi:hypothetical protein
MKKFAVIYRQGEMKSVHRFDMAGDNAEEVEKSFLNANFDDYTIEILHVKQICEGCGNLISVEA